MSKYDTLNEKLIGLIQKGYVPWRRPWKVYAPINPVTGTKYSGRNWLLLNAAPYDSPYWLTYNQAKAAGGQVRRGEEGWPIVWYGYGTDKKTGDPIQVLTGYIVFNSEQCDNVGFAAPQSEKTFNPIEKAEAIVAGYEIPIVHGGNKAQFNLTRRYIGMPERSRFDSEAKYYYTLFHELIHSTGPELKREMNANKNTKAYGFEELVAEIGAMYLCREAQIEVDPQSTASYLQAWIGPREWLKLLEGDKTFFIRASSAAQKAVNYILKQQAEEEVNAEA